MKLFLAQLRLSSISAMQYRSDYILTTLSVAISCVVEVALWRLVFKNTGQVLSYGLQELIVYTIIANSTQMMRVNWETVFSLSEEIRSGAVIRHLVKPLSLFDVSTAGWLAVKIPLMIGVIPVFILLAHFFPHVLHPSAWQVISYIALLGLSIWLSCEIYFIIIMSAFWIEENQGIALCFNIFAWGFAGMAFPLSFYPKWLQSFLDATPFPYFVYYPVMAILGKLPLATLEMKVSIGLAFCIFFFFLRRAIWHMAEERLQTVGG